MEHVWVAIMQLVPVNQRSWPQKPHHHTRTPAHTRLQLHAGQI